MKDVMYITAFYKFLPIQQEKLSDLRNACKDFGQAHQLRGLVLLATEGINATVCGTAEAIKSWKEFIITNFEEIIWKDSTADSQVFIRWVVDLRPERRL